MAFFQASEWHEGELKMREAMKVERDDNPTVPTLSPQLANHMQIAPLVAIGTLDKEGRPWTTLWGGEAPLASPLGGTLAGIRTQVTGKHDPVVEELMGKEATGTPVREEGKGRMVSGLTIDLVKRKRVKLYGRLVAGALTAREDEVTGQQEAIAEIQMVLKIEQSLGNCPKYLNCKRIEAGVSRPELVDDSSQLSQRGLDLVARSDLFFVSSSQHHNDMDTNHRGGPQGFLRVHSNEASGAVLIWPEYSGNRLYQTLGNLAINPLAGICIPDFTNGDMLYITGKTEILVGPEANEVLPKSNLAVKLTITSARYVATALPFRGVELQRSPYNPAVRYTSTEKTVAQSSTLPASITASLLLQTPITPSISRFRFALPRGTKADFTPGQYVTLDLSSHLYMGYSHMRDHDPLSINDDFIRTFTVSSAPGDSDLKENEFECTIRNVGRVTQFMFNHLGKEKSNSRKDEGLEVEVKGFGGEFEVQQGEKETVAFVAAGVGITPLMPSLATLDLARVKALWAVREADIPLVLDILDKFPKLAASLCVFITASKGDGAHAQLLRDKSVQVHTRRIEKGDMDLGQDVQKYYLCAPGPFRKQVMGWVEGKDWIFEDFDF